MCINGSILMIFLVCKSYGSKFVDAHLNRLLNIRRKKEIMWLILWFIDNLWVYSIT